MKFKVTCENISYNEDSWRKIWTYHLVADNPPMPNDEGGRQWVNITIQDFRGGLYEVGKDYEVEIK